MAPCPIYVNESYQLEIRAESTQNNENQHSVRFYIYGFQNQKDSAEALKKCQERGRLIITSVSYKMINPETQSPKTFSPRFYRIDDNACATKEIIYEKRKKDANWPPNERDSMVVSLYDEVVAGVYSLEELLSQ